MNMPEGIQQVVIIGIDNEDYVHILSYAHEETTRELLLEALEILDQSDTEVEKLH